MYIFIIFNMLKKYQLLHSKGKARVFTKKEADDFCGYNTQIILDLMIQNKLISRVKRGLYYIHHFGEEEIESDWTIFLPYLSDTGYVGYWSAIDRDSNTMYLVETRKNRLEEEEIKDKKIVYVKNAGRFDNHGPLVKEGFLDPKMAILDCILKPEYALSEEALLKEAKKYKKEYKEMLDGLALMTLTPELQAIEDAYTTEQWDKLKLYLLQEVINKKE